MKQVMKLGYNLVDCPMSWRNFVLQIQKDSDSDFPFDVPLQIIQQELSKFGARYVESLPDHVEFDSAKQLTWFMLQWS